MTVRLYNTLTRGKEVFTPIDPGNVRLYLCGPTVYNYAHIGNARPAVVFGLLARVLRRAYGREHVRYVSNITDIDDKIINAARETGEDISAVAAKFTRAYNDDMAALGVEPPDVQPRATDYIPHMLDMIGRLLAAGHAYEAQGHVLFHVPACKDYGRLSRRNREDMIAGARVEVAPYKKDPADFVLWKPSSDGQPGWDSPWGRGRPGWHLECSAMTEAIHGETFDIHAGGEDLAFPHHENEIAQSTCAHGGREYVKYWMHNGHVVAEGRKMSKSEGNFLLVRDLVAQYPPEALRLVLLSAHYRQPLDFTDEAVAQAIATLDKYYALVRDTAADGNAPAADLPPAFAAALEDDLNTPKALAELAALAKRLSGPGANDKEQARADFLAAARFMGFLQAEPDAWFARGADADEIARIEEQVAALQAARAARDYAAADAIRDRLKAAHGVALSMGKDGVQWRKER